jgi:uncharacterized protein involved in outer membrane biogenesis
MTRRALFGGAAALVVLAVAGLLALPRVLEAGALTARLDAALEKATGRAVSLGPISLRPSLRPAFTVAGATIANPPGLSRPDLARIDRVEITLGLLSLLGGRVEIDSVTLTGADILLERDAAGRPNWLFAPPERDTDAEAGPRLSLDSLQVVESRITLAGAGALEVPDLALRRQGDGIGLAGHILLAGRRFALEAELDAFAGPAPLRASLTGEGLRLTARGTLPRDIAAPGWYLALQADAADPTHVAAAMPGMVIGVAVAQGAQVTKGQKLLSLEAMKMETVINAERDGEIAQLLVNSGSQVEAGDLLLVLK